MDQKDIHISEDPIADSNKEEQLEILRSSLISSMQYDNSQDSVDLILHRVTYDEVRNYLESNVINPQEDEISKAKIIGCLLDDSENVRELLTNLKIKVEFIPKSIFFFVVESRDFASVVIPFGLSEEDVSVSIRPLESMPQYIKDTWWETKEGKKRRSLEKILEGTPKLQRGFGIDKRSGKV